MSTGRKRPVDVCYLAGRLHLLAPQGRRIVAQGGARNERNPGSDGLYTAEPQRGGIGATFAFAHTYAAPMGLWIQLRHSYPGLASLAPGLRYVARSGLSPRLQRDIVYGIIGPILGPSSSHRRRRWSLTARRFALTRRARTRARERAALHPRPATTVTPPLRGCRRLRDVFHHSPGPLP